MRLLLKLLAGLVAIVVVAGAGAAIWISTIDLEDVKRLAEREVEAATGRKLTIGGELDLELSLAPRIAMTDVRLANAGWGSEPTMISIGKADLLLDIVDLIAGRIDVERLALSDVDVLLETGPDKAENWDLGGSGSGGGIDPDLVPTLREVALDRIRLRLRTDKDTRTAVLDRLTLSTENRGTPIAAAFGGKLDDIPIDLEATLPSMAALLARPGSVPIEAKGTVDGREVTVAGTIEPNESEGSITVSKLAATMGGSDVSGTLTLRDGPMRPRLEGRLESRVMDVADLAPKGSGGGGDPLDQPIPYDLLGLVDAALSFKIGNLVADDITVEAIAMDAVLENAVLRKGPGTARFGGGALAFSAVVDGSVTPGRISTEGSLTDADFGALAAAHGGRDEFKGRGDAAWRIAGVGRTWGDILASSDGHTAVIVNEGVIANDYWELIAEDLSKQLLPMLEGSDRGTLNCIASRFLLRKGIAESQVLLIDSKRVTIAGEGNVDLRNRTMAIKLTPKPVDPSLFSLATPILIEGPIQDPVIGPDPVGLAKGVGAIALSTVNPLALALPLVSLGADESACPVAIAIARTGEVPAGARKSTTDQVGGTVKDAAEKAGDAIKGAAEGAGNAVKGLFDKLKTLGD